MEIQLTQGKVAIVDPQDYPILSKFKWYVVAKGKDKNYYYAARRDPNKPGGRIHMHRYILGAHNPKEICDHINRNTLDNRRSNLRITTKLENNLNRKIQKNNTSGYRGVTRTNKQPDKPWVAQFRWGGKLHYLGSYKTAKEASVVYQKKFQELTTPLKNFPQKKQLSLTPIYRGV